MKDLATDLTTELIKKAPIPCKVLKYWKKDKGP